MDIVQLPGNRYIWAGFFLILFFALFSNLGLTTLQFEEPRRAIVAMEMDLTGNYLVPKINGFLYYNKPPIYNWLVIMFFKIFQTREEWVFRLPTVLSFLTIALINFYVVRRKVSQLMAVHSSLIFLTSTNMLFYFSFQGEIDMFYTLIVYLQVLCLLHFFQKEDYFKLFIFSYLLTGVGVLTKGIPSLAFQAITILAIFIYHKRFKALFSIWNFVGIFLMAGIIGGYFYAYSLESDPLPMITRLITESSKRTLVEGSWFKSASQLYRFPLLMLTILMPWSLLIPSTKLKAVWKKGMSNEWVKLSTIFVAFNVIVYWLSPGARDRYLYMFIPFIAIVSIYLYAQGSSKFFSWSILCMEIIGLIGSLAIPIFSKELTLTHNIIITICLFLLSGGFIYLYWKYSSYRVFQLVCYLLLVRVIFNFFILPTRDKGNLSYESHAEVLVKHGVNAVLAEDYELVVFNPAIREDVTLKLIKHPPYQFSYYYSKKADKVLQYHSEEQYGYTYVCSSENFVPSENRRVLDTLDMSKKRADYLIYKLKKR